MNQTDPTKNSEGYKDLTPYEALKNIEENKMTTDEKIADKEIKKPTKEKKYGANTVRFFSTLEIIFKVCHAMGFDVVGRIQLRDKKTGRIWK